MQQHLPISIILLVPYTIQDELIWAAIWLNKATNEDAYINYVMGNPNFGGTRAEFSWNDKYVGAQVLIAQVKKVK